MSNKSPDDPDEYDAIFDDAPAGSDTYTKIEISDAEIIDGQQTLDAEIIDDNSGFMKNNSDVSEAVDSDIEEGIFAPERREKAVTKKSSSLMWAVSLLAFVGVGAFVYVSNPDIVAKVTQNMGSASDITVPNEVAAAEDAAAEQAAIENPPVNMETTTPSDVIVPDAHQEIPVDTPMPTDTAQVMPSPVVDDQTAVIVPTDPTPAVDTVISDVPPSTTDTPVVAVTTPVETTAPATIPEEKIDAAATSVMPAVNNEPSIEPVSPVAPVAVASLATATSPDAVTLVDDKEEQVDENIEDTVSAKPTTVAAPVVAAPAADTPVAVAAAAAQKAATSTEPKEKAPVIVASKEEKKALDDANLDKYFDSPSGQMLAGIPAPSMNPKKGSNESIIIVNKKGQKAVSKPPKSAGNIVIETTSLNTQLVSANRAVKLGRYDAAKEMYDELYRLNPRDAQILSGRAVLLQKMGLADQAISAYEELLKQYPDNADAIVNLSGLIRKEYPAVALNKLLDLQANHPNNVYVSAQLGVAYADAGNYDDALRYLGNAASMDPKNALHYYNMAVISEKASKPEQAVKYYEKALEVDTIYGEGHRTISKEKIYDRLAQIRGN